MTAEEDSRHKSRLTNVLYVVCFAAVVLMAVILRMYKAYYTGIIFDEALTYFRFARDFKSAVSNYSSTNNHLLNSVFIYLSVKLLGQSGSFMGITAIRLPAVFFGIVYVVTIAVIVERSLGNRILKLLVLLACLFNYFIFDLSVLARGYAIALGAVYAELMIVILYPRHLKLGNMTVAAVMSALNFIAVGAMLTSIYTVIPLNLAMLAVMYRNKKHAPYIIYDKADSAFKTTVETASAIACISTITLTLLYKDVFREILSASASPEAKNVAMTNSAVSTLMAVIEEGIFSKWPTPLSYLQSVFPKIIIPLTALLTVLFILNVMAEKKTLKPAALIVLTIISASFLLASVATTAGIPLGFIRNHIFWLPLVFLTAGIITDGALSFVDSRNLRPALLTTCIYVSMCLISGIVITGSFTSLLVVTTYDWTPQSVVGPLLRQLKKTDPKRRWRVGFSDKLEYCRYPYLFYNNEVYRIVDSDVAVFHISEKDKYLGDLYEYDLFKKFDCVVVLRPK